jgi:hypothetical protein
MTRTDTNTTSRRSATTRIRTHQHRHDDLQHSHGGRQHTHALPPEGDDSDAPVRSDDGGDVLLIDRRQCIDCAAMTVRKASSPIGRGVPPRAVPTRGFSDRAGSSRTPSLAAPATGERQTIEGRGRERRGEVVPS